MGDKKNSSTSTIHKIFDVSTDRGRGVRGKETEIQEKKINGIYEQWDVPVTGLMSSNYTYRERLEVHQEHQQRKKSVCFKKKQLIWDKMYMAKENLWRESQLSQVFWHVIKAQPTTYREC